METLLAQVRRHLKSFGIKNKRNSHSWTDWTMPPVPVTVAVAPRREVTKQQIEGALTGWFEIADKQTSNHPDVVHVLCRLDDEDILRNGFKPGYGFRIADVRSVCRMSQARASAAVRSLVASGDLEKSGHFYAFTEAAETAQEAH